MVRVLAILVAAGALAAFAAAPAPAATRPSHPLRAVTPANQPSTQTNLAGVVFHTDGVCSLPLLGGICSVGSSIYHVVKGTINTVSHGLSGLVKSAITGIATAFANGEAFVVEQTATVWTQVSTPSIANLTTLQADGTAGVLEALLLPITLAVALVCILIGAVKLILDVTHGGQHIEALAGYLLRYVVVSTLGVGLLALVISLSDQTASYLIGQATASHSFADQIGHLLGTVSGTGAKVDPASAFMFGLAGTVATAILAVILGFLAMLTTIFEIALMFVRGGLLVLLAGTLPLAAAMSGHRFGRQWLDKSISWSLAFALYKPAAAIVYCVAFALAGQSGPNNAIDIIDGLVMLLLALVALPALLRFCAPTAASVADHVAGAVLFTGAGAGLAGLASHRSSSSSGQNNGGAGPRNDAGRGGDHSNEGPTGSVAPDLASTASSLLAADGGTAGAGAGLTPHAPAAGGGAAGGAGSGAGGAGGAGPAGGAAAGGGGGVAAGLAAQKLAGVLSESGQTAADAGTGNSNGAASNGAASNGGASNGLAGNVNSGFDGGLAGALAGTGAGLADLGSAAPTGASATDPSAGGGAAGAAAGDLAQTQGFGGAGDGDSPAGAELGAGGGGEIAPAGASGSIGRAADVSASGAASSVTGGAQITPAGGGDFTAADGPAEPKAHATASGAPASPTEPRSETTPPSGPATGAGRAKE